MGFTMDCMDQKGYDHGLFGCLADPIATVAACCCPACAVGWFVGEAEGDGGFNVISCCCPIMGAYRLRRDVIDKMGPGDRQSADGSILALTFCTCCALAQDIHQVRKEKEMTSSVPPPVPPPTK